MARTARNAKLDTRSARVKFAQRREPYWTVISAGCAIGYRRGKMEPGSPGFAMTRAGSTTGRSAQRTTIEIRTD